MQMASLYVCMRPDLIFTMQLHAEPRTELQVGNLQMTYGHDEERNWEVTSSHPGKQYYDSWHERGGLIPPSSILSAAHQYTVGTVPAYEPEVIGISGYFYPIYPTYLDLKGIQRGLFGIHNDANVPGSYGCLVFEQLDEFKEFREILLLEAQTPSPQYDYINLRVIYN